MLRILHISDLHFGPYFDQAAGEALLRAAENLHPDVIVASGDFTQRAKPKQFHDCQKFLARLPQAPCVVTPGNHDVPLYRVHERVFAPYAQYRRCMGSERDRVWNHEQAMFVSLNTTAPLWRITEGIVRPRQLEFCRQALAAAAPGQMRIVVAHHPLALPAGFSAAKPATGSVAALTNFAELGVELILGGHLHLAFVAHSGSVCPDRSAKPEILIVHSGTTTSRRGRHEERGQMSFNFIEIDNEQICVTPHYFRAGTSEQFEPSGCHRFPRVRGGPSRLGTGHQSP